MQHIGFIGLGNMGAPIARNLIRAGYRVCLFNRTPDKAQAVLKAGKTGYLAESLSDFAECDVLFTCLALPQHVRQAVLGEKGAYAVLNPGTIHVELSTIAPDTAHELAEAAKKRGLAYIQCTLGKTPAHAERAETPLFVGGDPDAVERLKPMLSHIGIFNDVGTVDASCAVKLVSNMIGMANLTVLAAGLRIGERAGLDPQVLLPLLADTGARSFQMDVRGPWIASGDFAPRFALELALKDVRLGCEMAAGWECSSPIFEAALSLFRQADAAGFGAEDCAAVYNHL